MRQQLYRKQECIEFSFEYICNYKSTNKKTDEKILILAMSLFLFACAQAPQSFTVNGKIAGENEDKIIYLTSLSTGKKIDSTTVKDSKFMFNGVLDKSDIGGLSVYGVYPVYIVLEEGDIYIEFGKSMSAADSLSGTPLNVALIECYKDNVDIISEYSKVFREIEAKYKDDTKKIDSEVTKVMEDIYNPKQEELFNSSLEANRDNILGALFFAEYYISESKSVEEVRAFMLENPFAADFGPIKNILERKEFQENTAEGMAFADFTGRNMEDTEDVKLSDYAGKGKYVLVDFWATWCGPCIDVMPELAELHKKYAGKGLVLLSINVSDRREAAVKKIDELDMNWAQMYVPQGVKSIELYGENGIPTIILISPDGKIEKKKIRSGKVVEYIETLFE